jgi:competence protein ComFC
MSFPGASWLASWLPRTRPAAAQALNWVYPRICFGCNLPLSDPEPDPADLTTWLCHACRDALPAIAPPTCSVCGEPYAGDLTHAFQCWNCEGRRLAFDFATSAYRAEGLVRDHIHAFKYERRYELRGLLSQMLRRVLDDPRLAGEDLSTWLLVPVPLHRWREMLREYNQSWELAMELARATGIPAAKALRRTRRTTAQAGLDRDQRLENLRGAFALQPDRPRRPRPELAGRSILLVDDVLTTGSTCHECARILRRDGKAEKVVVITVARG